jgi:hypothetical protein
MNRKRAVCAPQMAKTEEAQFAFLFDFDLLPEKRLKFFDGKLS